MVRVELTSKNPSASISPSAVYLSKFQILKSNKQTLLFVSIFLPTILMEKIALFPTLNRRPI